MTQAHYTTTVVENPRRFDYWKEVVCRHCIPAASKPLAGGAFDGQLHVEQLGPLDICTVQAPLHVWSRDPGHLRTGPDEDLWLGWFEHADGELEQGGRKAALGQGALVMYDAAQTFRFALQGRSHLIRIPRHLLDARLPGVAQHTAVTLDDTRPGVVPLREWVRQAVAMPNIAQDAALSMRWSETLLDLLVLSMELQDLATVRVEKDLYARALGHIQRHFTDPELDVAHLATALHVSTRTLARAFARQGKAAAAVIWAARLQASREALASGRARSVSQAALDYGFSDFSHFSHAFRRTYGVTPQSLLHCRHASAQ